MPSATRRSAAHPTSRVGSTALDRRWCCLLRVCSPLASDAARWPRRDHGRALVARERLVRAGRCPVRRSTDLLNWHRTQTSLRQAALTLSEIASSPRISGSALARDPVYQRLGPRRRDCQNEVATDQPSLNAQDCTVGPKWRESQETYGRSSKVPVQLLGVERACRCRLDVPRWPR